MKIIFFALIILFSGYSNSQELTLITSKEFIQDLRLTVQRLNQDDFSMIFKKEVFKDKSSNEIVASSNGIIQHGQGRELRSQCEGITIVQNEELNVLIDSAERLIQISEADTSFNPSSAIANFNEESLKNFKLYRGQSNKFSIYKLVPKILSEGTIELYIDNKTKHIYKMIISYPPANYFSENLEDESLEEPYAIIVYEPLKNLSDQEKTMLFNVSTFIQPIENGRFKVTDAFKEYEIYDSRYTTN